MYYKKANQKLTIYLVATKAMVKLTLSSNCIEMYLTVSHNDLVLLL